jgi:hypothetical protein
MHERPGGHEGSKGCNPRVGENQATLAGRVQPLDAAQVKQLELLKWLIELQSPENQKQKLNESILNELGRMTAPRAWPK